MLIRKLFKRCQIIEVGFEAGDVRSPHLKPCRNFQRGHDVVAGGEVVALDSAGYGPVTITKSVTITGDGVYAGITATSGTAVTIATAGITVNLRSLTIEGVGTGTNGFTSPTARRCTWKTASSTGSLLMASASS